MKIYIIACAIWVLSLFLVGYASYNYRSVDICQYSKKEGTVDIKKDPVVSQNPLNQNWQTFDEVECNGKVRIYRDNKLKAQSFTIVIPLNKYHVKLNQVGNIMNIMMVEPSMDTDTSESTSTHKFIDKQEISL